MGAAVGLSTLFQVGSGLLGAYSAYASGKAQEAAYKANAAVKEQNARVEEAQADEALARGARKEHQFRQQAEQQAAAQESALAASGATLSGSALQAMGDTRIGIEEDVTAMQYGTAQERWSHQVQAVDFRNQARADRAAAKNARTAGLIGMGTSLLGSAMKFANGGSLAATYRPSEGIAVEPRFGGWYNSPRNTAGTITDNLIKENPYWHNQGLLR